MPKSITGNTPAPQNGNLTGNANTAYNQFKTATIARLESEIYDNLTLERERLNQITKLIDTVISDLAQYPSEPAYCIYEANTTLGIIQYLLMNFRESVNYDIGQLEGDNA